MALIISEKIQQKLTHKHGVSRKEVVQCFANRDREIDPLIDDREENRTDPPTHWLIAETDHGRRLKVVFVVCDDQNVYLKTAYEPSRKEMRMFFGEDE
ncbi:BrnT family toxin [Marinobacterium lutimaris]|uniref:ADP-ribosyl-(dinitrogen reductase) hydrolase n=1 Tax=Marinobacterium lutimaris TaxID=568106 RepID=UPI000CDEF419|nr:ADP-ribosyl-(dinitrogen reductase) hydrolase [Marinobacterium lutimaris]